MIENQKLIEIKIIITDELSTFNSNIDELPSRIFEILKHNGLNPKDVSVHKAQVFRQEGLKIEVEGNGHSTSSEKFGSEEYPESADKTGKSDEEKTPDLIYGSEEERREIMEEGK